MRTTVSVCAGLLLCTLGLGCSSKSTHDGASGGGTGGSPSGSAGTPSNSGGASSNSGGASSNSGGASSNSGGTGTGGTTAQAGTANGGGGAASACENAPVVCVDETTASACDPDTGMQSNFNCVEESKPLGLVSSGCTMDATNGDHCAVDDFADQGCADAIVPFGVCQGFMPEDALDIYVACYQDIQGLHDVISCYAPYYDATAQNVDCVGANAACAPTM